MTYAQTNLQFFSQLRREGRSETEQGYLADAYRLAADLFSGQYRGCDKPFIAHLVGTASVLASLGAPGPVVAAGLLHAAYEQGDFGLGLTGRHHDKRREVQRILGVEAESYVQAYFSLRWTDETIAKLLERSDTWSAGERITVLIRLANELEEYLDLGLAHRANVSELARRASAAACQRELANRLNEPRLAEELAQQMRDNAAASIPPAVRGPRMNSHLRRPRSYSRRFVVAIRSSLTRFR